MSKITLSTVSSGFLSNTTMTLNFQAIQNEFQNKVLYRNNTSGEANTMMQDLDMNGYRVLNALAQSGEGFIWKGTWVAGTSYVINNLVTVPSGTYTGYSMIAKSAFTSLGTFDLDYAAGHWDILASRGASGAGTGDMLKSENLLGLTNTTTAKTNLQIISGSTGSLVTPNGTTAQRDGSPSFGYMRGNSTLNIMEWWNGTAWSTIGGGATGAGGDSVFIENDQVVTTDYTLTAGKNAVSAGTITIISGVTVTVPTDATWSIV